LTIIATRRVIEKFSFEPQFNYIIYTFNSNYHKDKQGHMNGWRRQSPLHEVTGASPTDPALLRELPHCGKLVFQARGEIETVREAFVQAVGQELPVEPNTSTDVDHRVLWLSQRKWLIVLEPEMLRDTHRRLKEALMPQRCLVSDVSDGRIVLEVAGDRARDLLAGVCPLDLNDGHFGPGRCAQSLLVRVPLLLHQVDSRPGYHLYVDRSFARYAWDWLSDAAIDPAMEHQVR
jgi:sarcosine oxidase subunit gamma